MRDVQNVGGWHDCIGAEVLRKALARAASEYAEEAERAADEVIVDSGKGTVPAAAVPSLDAWHEAVLRHEHALALLRRLGASTHVAAQTS